jgi:hypothetical protein
MRADSRAAAKAAGVFVWRFASDTIEKVAIKGDNASPGTFKRVERPWMSPGGRISFGGKTKGGPKRAVFLFE